MRWPWSRKPKLPDIPPHQPPPPIQVHTPKREEGIVVEEVDTSAMTRTGVHRVWDRMRGKRE